MSGFYGIPVGFDYTSMNEVPDKRSSKTRPLEDPSTIMGQLSSSPDFTMFTYLIYAAGLDNILRDNKRELTVFAPPDRMFRDLPDDMMRGMDIQTANSVVSYHILPYILDLKSMELGEQCVKTLNKRNCLLINARGLMPELGSRHLVMAVTPTINYTPSIIEADHTASNGIIHVINSVLIPDTPPGDYKIIH
jgi:uncharacterized surface protein with fasciclin (FAS1) repeats